MGLKDFLPLKLKAFRLRRLNLLGNIGKRKRERREASKPSWMTPISHGFHVVESEWYKGDLDSDESEFDSVVAQREQIDELELWFFGVSDAWIGDALTKHLQTHFFDRKPKRQIRRKGKEAMRKAYLGVKAKIRETQIADETSKAGSVSAMVIDGDKLVIANMGDYKAVLCRDGVARPINAKTHRRFGKRHWSRRLISVKMLGCQVGNIAKSTQPKSSDLVVGTERVDSDTEFLILASKGIWEAMKPQEAVSLISHLEDPQKAAECLTREAITRVSKSNISCLVVRFD